LINSFSFCVFLFLFVCITKKSLDEKELFEREMKKLH
jgi:hypothetical protein